jgi:class 3 adenylate cyclase
MNNNTRSICYFIFSEMLMNYPSKFCQPRLYCLRGEKHFGDMPMHLTCWNSVSTEEGGCPFFGYLLLLSVIQRTITHNTDGGQLVHGFSPILPIRYTRHCIFFESFLFPSLCLFFVIFLVPSVSPASTLSIHNGQYLQNGPVELGGSLEILEDESGSLTVDRVLSGELDERFSPHTGIAFNPGFSNTDYWARYSLKNTLPEKKRFFLEINTPLMDLIEVYQLFPDGTLTLQKNGENVPFNERPAFHRRALFNISLPANETCTFLIRFENKGSVPFQPRLWLPEVFRRHVEQEMFILGIYYGAIGTILFYNLVLYLMVRQRNYLAYVLYVLSYLLWQLTYNGLAGQFFWPRYPWLNHHAISFFISLSGISALQFARQFLSTRKLIPKMDLFIRIVIGGFTVSLVFSILPNYSLSIFLAATMAVIFSPTLLIASLLCLRKGYGPARYFVIAWFMLIFGTAILGLKSFGLLPSTPFSEYAQQAGSFVEILLLSFALADQMNLMKKEKEQAREKALSVQKEATLKLEEKVAKRTFDLQESNQKLQMLSTKLSKYLSPQVYDAIFTGRTEAKQSNYRKKLTVFFSDIMGFTEMTDCMEPESLNQLLNYYLNSMTEIALKFGGTIDKFIGDAILVFFGDPESSGEKEDALNCIKMALEMRRYMQAGMNPVSSFHTGQRLQIRIGINTGYCTVGNFGSENRLDYTIIGGQVNLASRLEGLAEPNQILISANTYELVREHIACREKGEVKVKGIAYPVKTYQVIGLPSPGGPVASVHT